jgi:hypothetical protein
MRKRIYIFYCLKFGILPWIILTIGRYFYNYGFNLTNPDWQFKENSTVTLLVFIAIALSYFASNGNEKKDIL